jgi:hypothetical protein
MKIPLKHKFGAKRCARGEIKFPSQLERAAYDTLQALKANHSILFFLRQVPFDIPGAKHIVDFLVFTQDRVLFIEAKGKDLSLGKLKRQQVEQLYDIDIHVVHSQQELIDVVKTQGF